jgi:hypothetical protein
LFVEGRIGQVSAGAEPVHDLPEQPGSAIAAATDHDPVRARLIQRGVRILRRADVAVDDHGDADRRLDRADEAPIGAALVHLVAGAAMDGDHSRPEILRDPREFGGVQAVVAPAHPHLQRDRDRYGFDNAGNDLRGEFQVAHQRGPGVAAGHLAHRAAHVDVDDRGAAILGEPRASPIS